MEAIAIFGGFVLLLIFGIVWAAGAPKRTAKKLVGATVDRARPMTARSLRWLVEVTVTGEDAAAMHAALGGHVLAGDMVGDLIEQHLRATSSTLGDEEELGDALLERLRPSMKDDGFRVDRVRVLGHVDPNDDTMRNLARYVATECYHANHGAQLSCPVSDLYLDGIAGRGDWTVEVAPRPGAIVTTLTSVRILEKQDHIMEVSKDGASIVTNRSFAEMLKGK